MVKFMQENKIDNLELFYDCVDESNNILYEATHKNYFELIEMTVENILNSEVVCDVDDETTQKLNLIYEKTTPYTSSPLHPPLHGAESSICDPVPAVG